MLFIRYGRGESILIKDAIVRRFQELCAEHDISYIQLAQQAGVTPSTIYSMMNAERKEVRISTIKKLCDGLNISIKEFFDSELFEDLPQEII